jgi:hypothetical protein
MLKKNLSRSSLTIALTKNTLNNRESTSADKKKLRIVTSNNGSNSRSNSINSVSRASFSSQVSLDDAFCPSSQPISIPVVKRRNDCDLPQMEEAILGRRRKVCFPNEDIYEPNDISVSNFDDDSIFHLDM